MNQGRKSESLQNERCENDAEREQQDEIAPGERLTIGEDNSITILSGRVELGTGVRTALAQIAADELYVPLASVTVAAVPYGAQVSEGEGVPYTGWMDWGGNRPRGGPRSYLPEGRYLFPAAGDLGPEATIAVAEAYQVSFDRYSWTNRSSDPGSIRD